jgi:hypothetical protein
MEAGSHSGIACLVQQSLGTGALFHSYVFVTIIVDLNVGSVAVVHTPHVRRRQLQTV